MLNLKEIINNCNKYHYIYINTNKQNKIYKYKSFSEKKDINIKNNDKLVLIKLKTLSKKLYIKEKKSPIKVSGGPLYAEINVYQLNDGKYVKEPPKIKNKVYFPKKYLKEILEKNYCKIIKKDILKICEAYINDRLHQGLLAINTINNI